MCLLSFCIFIPSKDNFFVVIALSGGGTEGQK